MVRCWYMEESSFDQRLEHHFDPCQYLSLLELFDCTGVECFKVDHESYETDETLKNLRTERGYTFEDEIHFHSGSPNYEEKLQNFYTEHLHTHEEIRLIVAGSGYFDVRDKDDRWIRLKVTAGDLIIIPSELYKSKALLYWNTNLVALQQTSRGYVLSKRIFGTSGTRFQSRTLKCINNKM
ncbi:PREDICTED: 1,2-dihydroxy-3-keto-5-methylthiopentene dioxygenase isoform X2 [Ceratosolen solmsi marchali]|uniref:acireductone dioxygenase (Fe(2+)-requiring) n=1 Tax=Ceratosolen solmsi marchali TaxID=326594 RepID=A0AAJ6YVD9_9HYME|nr:PREDICTED: 1,2-dihydroxy-3-keto-5-methylthiopentene dioxygenase isoform X2 [Ceratosolen solmsi marchali]